MDFAFGILVFVSVLFITDPVANIPIFLGFTRTYSNKERHELIGKSHIIAMVAFFLFSFFGVAVFEYLNISLSSFKMAAGFLLFVIALEMLLGFHTRTEITPNEQEQAEEKENVAITPLAVPLITGPGAIITGIVLFSRAVSTELQALFVAGAVAAFAAGLVLFWQAERISKIVGPIGLKVTTRIMGLLLMSLAVQFMVNGIKESGLLA